MKPSSACRRLDEKLARLRAGSATCRDFIIADAKDADMAFGIASPGVDDSTGRWKNMADFRAQIRAIVEQDIVDIMLLSASSLEHLALTERLFESSRITPAGRANDSSDIWCVRGGSYRGRPSRPFRSATIDHLKYGQLSHDYSQPARGADLGLYSITFTNNLEQDHQTLSEYAAFRLEAEQKQFRHFLEVFNPNIDTGLKKEEVAAFVNDHIVRTLAGVMSRGRPLFLKVPYNGPAAMEELVSFDSGLIVGVLGGGAGTSLDAFQLIYEAQKHGARVALFGRKINLAEDPLSFIRFLRLIVDQELKPREAVKAYHDAMEKQRIKPKRPLIDDLQLTDTSLDYRPSS